MGRRILNRKELRADAEAAERRKPGEEEEEAEEEGEDEDEDEEDEEKEKGDEVDEEAEPDDEDDDEAEVLPKKKKKAVKAAKAPKAAKPKSRSRAAKIVRMRLVWGVFNNSHQCVATYDYPKRKDADAHAAKLMGDKKTTHFVQPVKEPIEEKKDETEVVKTRGK